MAGSSRAAACARHWKANDARAFERGKPNLRLVDGETLIGLIYNLYHRFEPRWQRLIPLRRVYITGGVAASED